MRSPLTQTIKRVEGMITYVRENLDDGEYDLFLDLILPEPEPAKAAKKGRKKSSKGGSKSSRASGMAAAINRSLSQQREAAVGGFADDVDGLLCRYEFENGGSCKRTSDHNVHHLQTDSLYHEFVAGGPVAHEARAGG